MKYRHWGLLFMIPIRIWKRKESAESPGSCFSYTRFWYPVNRPYPPNTGHMHVTKPPPSTMQSVESFSLLWTKSASRIAFPDYPEKRGTSFHFIRLFCMLVHSFTAGIKREREIWKDSPLSLLYFCVLNYMATCSFSSFWSLPFKAWHMIPFPIAW